MKEELIKLDQILPRVADGKEVLWSNPKVIPFEEAKKELPLGMEDILDAEGRLERFAPLIAKLFPETKPLGGIIESPLQEIPSMKELMEKKYDLDFQGGRLFLKRDSDLAVAGSVKARGGIYEVLKHTEDLIGPRKDWADISKEELKDSLSEYKVQVGSTGNLGMSIGIMSAALGYEAIVHMSKDAKEWKKEKLRSQGVTVIEYEGDYGEAVAQGRSESDQDPKSYFVDDENSKDLFLGYSVAALRLKKQLEDLKISVDGTHPLIVYIPCGVGGAPGGIAFGLKEVYGDNVKVFFVEPTEAPCMLVGLATGMHNKVSVQDLGLSGNTHADGLAVSRPSGFVGKVMEPLLEGEITVKDSRLYDYLRDLKASEEIFIEPSSCAGFQGPLMTIKEYPENFFKQGTHIVWATGGSLVPEKTREEFYNTYL